jgi:heterotetrameric sarcosine oxidase gamma subunit
MLKAGSALATAKPYKSNTLKIAEASDFILTQYAGAEKDLKKALGKLPTRVGVVQDNFLRISPTQIWSLNDAVEAPNCFVTPLSSSRTRIEISGAPARDVLAKCAAIDFHPKEFKAGQFVMTGIHHVPVLIHCISAETFHLYIMRTFALSIWDFVTDAALEFA